MTIVINNINNFYKNVLNIFTIIITMIIKKKLLAYSNL